MINWEAVKMHIRSGQPICLYDFSDRENETDVVCIGHPVDAYLVDFIRREVGGPLSVFLSSHFLQRLGISTYTQFVADSGASATLRHLIRQNRGHDPRYAISIDARDNLTGCSPLESAHTISVLYDLVVRSSSIDDEELAHDFAESLIAPGHIPIVCAVDALLAERRGHVELSLTIARMLELPEIVVAGELIDHGTLTSMKPEVAATFAQLRKFPFITGDDVLNWINAKTTIS